MTTAEVGFENTTRPALALVPSIDDELDALVLVPSVDLEIDPDVAEQLRRCAAGAGLSVSLLLRALLSVQVPKPCVGDLVRTSRHGDSIFKIERASADGRYFLGTAHGLHRSGSVISAGWLPPEELRRVERTDR